MWLTAECVWFFRHDFHHSHNVGCYGTYTAFWDWVTVRITANLICAPILSYLRHFLPSSCLTP